jgi:glutathione S-transferase
MLELYHHGSSVCAAKVRIALEEKGLEFEKHYVDTLAGEQFDPAFLKINPKAVVPVLIHDSRIITEPTVICEYLHWAFPDTPNLIPDDPVTRAHMLYWTKFVGEEVHPACGTLTFRHRTAIRSTE